MMRLVHGVEVFGADVDAETRCAHWHSDLDVVAIKFKCCAAWYPCSECHAAVADHDAVVWPVAQRDSKAVLCGACGRQLSIGEYLECDSTCPACGAAFNPGCTKHYDLYFG
jgi:uncharacterized CHY-type Zn-finger protein